MIPDAPPLRLRLPLALLDNCVTPYFQDATVTLFHGDCQEFLNPPAPHGYRYCMDAALVTDPPYGINWKPRVNHQDAPWVDDTRPRMAAMVDRFGWACVWGGNYFADQLPVSNGWLIWLKRPSDGSFDGDLRTFSTAELAWTNFIPKPRTKTLVWDGGKREGDTQNRMFCHPAQKPIEVMRWCLGLLPKDVSWVCDPFAGSGTTLVAAKQIGMKCVGVEREEKYCEIAANRLRQGALTEMFQ